MVDLPRLCSLMLLIVPGTFLAGSSPPHAFVDQFQEVFRILSNVSPPSQHSIVWLPYVCGSQDSCCCCWFPGSAVGRHISLAFVDGLGLVVQPSARPPWAGSVLFVLGSGVTSAPISLGVLCCLSPLRSVQFLSGLLWLGICPMLSLMESGWPEKKLCLEGTPRTQGRPLLKYPAQLSRCRSSS